MKKGPWLDKKGSDSLKKGPDSLKNDVDSMKRAQTQTLDKKDILNSNTNYFTSRKKRKPETDIFVSETSFPIHSTSLHFSHAVEIGYQSLYDKNCISAAIKLDQPQWWPLPKWSMGILKWAISMTLQ